MVPDFLVAVPRFISEIYNLRIYYVLFIYNWAIWRFESIDLFFTFSICLSYDGQRSTDWWSSVSWMMTVERLCDAHHTITSVCAKLRKDRVICKLLHVEIMLLTSLSLCCIFASEMRWVVWLTLTLSSRLKNIACYFSSRSVSNAEQTLSVAS